LEELLKSDFTNQKFEIAHRWSGIMASVIARTYRFPIV
jgi:hypothetical protein